MIDETKIGAILTYHSEGLRDSAGKVDGYGDYGVIYMGEPAACEYQARAFLESLRNDGYRITDVLIIVNEPTGNGPAVRVVVLEGAK